jgi:hypothetical protein
MGINLQELPPGYIHILPPSRRIHYFNRNIDEMNRELNYLMPIINDANQTNTMLQRNAIRRLQLVNERLIYLLEMRERTLDSQRGFAGYWREFKRSFTDLIDEVIDGLMLN